ncbi:MAG: hypothetical protein V1885_03395 [Candidatus Brennerbacteria bacterium]
MTSETKICQNCHGSFTIEPDDFGFYQRLDLPAPFRCPKCEWQYLLAFWIFGRFRISVSALSGKRIITALPESVPFPIYERDEFVSDAWDPLSYGRDHDPRRPFLTRLLELQASVPHPHQTGIKNVNCDWTDDVWESRDAYLTRSGLGMESVSYCYRAFYCKNSIDLTYCFNTEHSYDCLHCFNGYGLKYSFNCRACINSAFLYDCRNCTDCFMCWNLRNKQYHILNQPYSKEDYLVKIKEFDVRSYAVVEQLRKEFWEHIRNDATHRADYNFLNSRSTGNFLTEDKNCHKCYFLDKSENCRYCFRGLGSKDNIYIMGSVGEKCGRGSLDQWGYENVCNLYTSYCRYSAYLDNCEECEHCFGCVGLRKRSYCVLNKQYSKEQYEELVLHIKSQMKATNEWGLFFPLAGAYSGYNYSLAHLMFPKFREEALAFGAKWDELPHDGHVGVRSEDLPDRIDGVQDELTKQRIICAATKLSYNIAPHELQFYREHGVPLPREHFDWRTFKRFKPLALMVDLQREECVYCGKEIEHYYSPELGFRKVACVECYQQNFS